jgi:hypothetical protein
MDSGANNLVCSVCKLVFNLKNREPIVLFCCSKTACRECVEKKMIKGDKKDVVVKGKFDCSLCHADHYAH